MKMHILATQTCHDFSAYSTKTQVFYYDLWSTFIDRKSPGQSDKRLNLKS